MPALLQRTAERQPGLLSVSTLVMLKPLNPAAEGYVGQFCSANWPCKALGSTLV